MGKTKDAGTKSQSSRDPKSMTSVKDGGITKPSKAPKAKAQEVAKKVAEKASKAGEKIKEIVKEPDSSEDDEELEEQGREVETSESSKSSDSEAEQKPAVKANGAAKAGVNGSAKRDDSGAESDEESEGDSEDESEDEAVPTAKAPAAEKSAPKEAEDDKAAASSEEDDEDDNDDDEEDSDSDEEESKPKKGPIDPKALQGRLSKISSKEESPAEGDSNDGSGSDSSEEDSEGSSSEDETEKAPPKKRKADEDEVPHAKKSRVDEKPASNLSKNLFVGRLSWNVDSEWLKSEFEKFGEVVEARVMINNEGKSRGFGFVEFSELDAARDAHDSMKGTEIDGREINVDYSEPRKDNSAAREQRARFHSDRLSAPSTTLFVGNVSFGANEDMLGEVFGEYGTVLGVRLPTKPEDGEIKGFGYVEFASIDDATAALQALNGQPIAGRPVRLDYSNPRAGGNGPPRGDRGDRGGRGGPRGGGRGDRGGGRGSFRSGGPRGGGRGGSTNRGGFGDFKGTKMTF